MVKARFLPQHTVEEIATNDLQRYLWLSGKKELKFPLDLEGIFRVLFDLETVYFDFDSIGLCAPNGQRILGVLYPSEKKIAIHTGRVKPPALLASKEIQRFSLAHEGAHYCLHYSPDSNQVEFFSSRHFLEKSEEYVPYTDPPISASHYLEVQANQYADALLMPREHLIKAIDDVSRSLLAIYSTKIIDFKRLSEPLSEKFGVSKTCLRNRLQKVGIKWF